MRIYLRISGKPLSPSLPVSLPKADPFAGRFCKGDAAAVANGEGAEANPGLYGDREQAMGLWLLRKQVTSPNESLQLHGAPEHTARFLRLCARSRIWPKVAWNFSAPLFSAQCF